MKLYRFLDDGEFIKADDEFNGGTDCWYTAVAASANGSMWHDGCVEVRRSVGDLSTVTPARCYRRSHIEHGGLFFHDFDDARKFALELLAATEQPTTVVEGGQDDPALPAALSPLPTAASPGSGAATTVTDLMAALEESLARAKSMRRPTEQP